MDEEDDRDEGVNAVQESVWHTPDILTQDGEDLPGFDLYRAHSMLAEM